MSLSNVALIAAVDAESAVREIPDASLEDRARAAMQAVQNHWMATREEDQFLGACEGLARVASEEERERIVDDLERLGKASGLIHALQAGVPVDWEAMAAEADAVPENPLGLRKMWQEVCGAR